MAQLETKLMAGRQEYARRLLPTHGRHGQAASTESIRILDCRKPVVDRARIAAAQLSTLGQLEHATLRRLGPADWLGCPGDATQSAPPCRRRRRPRIVDDLSTASYSSPVSLPLGRRGARFRRPSAPDRAKAETFVPATAACADLVPCRTSSFIALDRLIFDVCVCWLRTSRTDAVDSQPTVIFSHAALLVVAVALFSLFSMHRQLPGSSSGLR
ncbi:hypothetical protein CDD83_5443 [Cordyceps sp. RAO-2017]|nr:hypothetical protein CDD83_5443 [Cordyceps sp. RAO-2017]